MAATNGTPIAPTREQLRERKKRVKQQLELRQIEQMESVLWDGFGGSDLMFSLRDRYSDGDGGWVPISVVGDRKKGQNWPLWQTEQQLGELRQKSRIVCQSNGPAICLLSNLQNHIVGKGYTYKCQPKKSLDKSDVPGVQADDGAMAVVTAVQAFVDRFLAVNRWTSSISPSLLTSPGVGCRERETCRRVYRDGEAFLRLFAADSGMTYVRFVEPEQVTNNGGRSLLANEGWSFGIQHAMEPFEDEERTEAYHVAYKSNDDGRAADGEIVPAAEMIHVKLPDEDAAVKRGTPAFSFDTLDAFVRGSKLQRNLSVSSAIQAATAEIWKHATGTQSQIASISQQLGERQFANPVTGKTEQTERVRPGQIRRIPQGQEPVPTNFGVGSKSEFISVVQADLRAAGSSFNAPEYFTGDASNANFSSTKEAGTPFVIATEVVQEHFKIVFAVVVWRAIAHAVKRGLLPSEALKVVELQVEPTAVPPTDPLQAAQENQIYTSIKVKSRQTCQMELGLDPDHEDANIEEDEQKFGMGGAGGGNPLAAMMGGDGGGGQQPPTPDATARMPGLAESLLENFTGVDAHGHHWQNGKQVAVGDNADPTKPPTGSPDAAVATWAAAAKTLPAKVYAMAKAKVQSHYTKLSARYGKRTAIAIMAAGVAGLPLPIPGSSLITAAPVIAVAEMVRAWRGGTGHVMESEEATLTPEQIKQAGKAFLLALLQDAGEYDPAEQGADTVESLVMLESGFTGIDSHGHKWADGKQVAIGKAPANGGGAAAGDKTQWYADQLKAKFGDGAHAKVMEMIQQHAGHGPTVVALAKAAHALVAAKPSESPPPAAPAQATPPKPAAAAPAKADAAVDAAHASLAKLYDSALTDDKIFEHTDAALSQLGGLGVPQLKAVAAKLGINDIGKSKADILGGIGRLIKGRRESYDRTKVHGGTK